MSEEIQNENEEKRVMKGEEKKGLSIRELVLIAILLAAGAVL